MEIKIPILSNPKIKWVGIVNFSELYTDMKNWLEDNGYAKEKELEKKYIQRIKPEGRKQIEIAWQGRKKVSDFFNYHIDTTILVLAMSDVEVQEESVKVKRQKGTFEVRINSYIQSTDEWEKLRGIQKLYQEMFIRKRINVYIEELYKKSVSYHSYIKSLIGLRD